jgi:lipopolysaccharide export system protein LptC
VRIAKYGLPVIALALLSSIALWPELSRTLANGRVTWKRLSLVVAGSGEIVAPRYHGLDERGRPYMVSADIAERAGPERLNMTRPRGDVTLANGSWLQVQSKQGVFMQHLDELDLQGDVTLYRQDGTTMTSRTSTINLRQGAATSDEYTHAEGPFGTLDAQGFTLLDKGGLIQFHGPAHLVLNGAH